MSTHNLCFGSKIRKIGYPCKPHFFYIKVRFNGVHISWICFPDEKVHDVRDIVFQFNKVKTKHL